MVMLQVPGGLKTRVADPKLRREVEAAVRRRVRGDDAEDVVQSTLADVLAARQVPEDPDEFRRFVFGVARNKVFDHFRRRRRTEGLDDADAAAPETPLAARDMLRWAEGELAEPDAQSTLEWMLREGDGEKLEHIARDAQLPATRVRKRVSRLRKLLRERWVAELTLVGLLVALSGLGALHWYSRGRTSPDLVEREPPRPLPSAPQQLPSSRPAGSAEPSLKVAPVPSTSASFDPSPAPSAPPFTKAPPKRPPTPKVGKPTFDPAPTKKQAAASNLEPTLGKKK
jgi:DNA-directed RNA polymerase specialized sigma24 family protein